MLLMFMLILDGDEKEQCDVDLIICLGGDGTLIHTSSLFQVIFHTIPCCRIYRSPFLLGFLGFVLSLIFSLSRDLYQTESLNIFIRV